jgi:hypothetical protein
MDIETYHDGGFVDLADAFRDDNESRTYDSGEPYFNTKSSDGYQGADSVFNGPQCQGSLCDSTAITTYIRKALVLTMSGSTANIIVRQNGTVINGTGSDIANGSTETFNVQLTDSANQILPAGTTLTVTSTLGDLQFDGYTVPSMNAAGGTSTSFTLKNEDTSGLSQVTLTATTPKGVVTTQRFFVTLL